MAGACEGPGVPLGSNVGFPYHRAKTSLCHEYLVLCKRCEDARFDDQSAQAIIVNDKNEHTGTQLTKEAGIKEDEFYDIQENLTAPLKAGNIIIANFNKTYPSWPGKVLLIHPNGQNYLVEFFHTKNWMILPTSKLHRYEDIAPLQKKQKKLNSKLNLMKLHKRQIHTMKAVKTVLTQICSLQVNHLRTQLVN